MKFLNFFGNFKEKLENFGIFGKFWKILEIFC
jgi:hypothetical protein